MNAGKSTNLLQSSHNYHERGMTTVIFTPEVDNRYRQGEVHSRIGLSAKAVSFGKKFDFFQYVKSLDSKPNCILIDEAQFLQKDQVKQLTEITDQLNIPVLAYGLRSDYKGEPFEASQYLLAWAEELVEIKTICDCGRKATMNMRVNAKGEKITEGDQVFIGGNDDYIATCRLHYKQGKAFYQVPKDKKLTSEVG